jgi:hypothetical protein
MPYTHFRYIAYEVPTATFQPGGNVESGFDAGEEYQAIGRLPVPDGVPNDARIRLKRLAGVVNFAANRIQAFGDNANTLKIFMAPEFFFRPPATLGANYLHHTYPNNDQAKILAALNGMFVHADFQDWLFVPGTIMWNTSLDTRRATLFFNTVIHIRGGLQNALNVIEKKQPSGIDGVPVTGAPILDAGYKIVHQRWQTRKRHVFAVNGTELGLEICLDHLDSGNCRVLKTVLSDWEKYQGNNQEISLHLLSAGGMSIQVKSVAARINGYILRNDGLANPGARSELRKVLRYTEPDPLAGKLFDVPSYHLGGTASLGPSIVVDVGSFPLPAGPLTVPMKPAPYRQFPQRIVIYPPQPLP